MKNKIFIDTSGFYALMVKNDEKHSLACGIVEEAKTGKYSFLSSDYVIDETVTLLKARRFAHAVPNFLEIIETSNVCTVEWTNSGRFKIASTFCTKHLDKDYSFTDCLIITLMKELGLKRILTKDAHFKTAGFDAILT